MTTEAEFAQTTETTETAETSKTTEAAVPAASTSKTTAAQIPDAMSREAYKRLRRMNKSELSAYISRVWLDAYKTGYQDGARNAKK